MFVLVSTGNLYNWRDEVNWPSFVLKIEDTLHEFAEQYHTADDGVVSVSDIRFRENLQASVFDLSDEIDEWYYTQWDSVLTIKTSNPQVSEIYTQSLRSSMLSRQLLEPTHQQLMEDGGAFNIATNNFLESLIDILWKWLRLNNFCLVYVKDRMLELYGKLRSLRTILKQQHNIEKDDDIVFLLHDAGVLIFSLYQTHTAVDLGCFRDFLETLKTTLLQLEDKDSPVPKVNVPKTNQLGSVDFVLEKLANLTSREAEPIPNNNNHVQTVHEQLVTVRSFLGDIVDFYQEHEEYQALWNLVLEVTCKVECLIDQLLVDDLRYCPSISVDAILEDIRDIKAKTEVMRPQNRLKEATRTYHHQPSQMTLLEANDEVVGFSSDAKLILDRLKRGSKQLKVIAIVGMPGLGKTTLASKVYNDDSISLHFQVHAWCAVSQALDKKNVLFQLLKQVDPNSSCSMLSEQDWVEKLWRSLKGKRYLLYLDDIWDNEAWNSLAPALPDDNYGSRILLTSRNQGIAPSHMLDQEPHFLKSLNEKKGWELLQRKLFPAFPEDAEIRTTKLFYIWVAEGFVRETDGKRIKDVAEDYLNGLIGKSLVMGAKKKWNGEVKTCRIRDLLRDYCLQKSKEEQFFHVIKGYDELSAFNEPSNLRRLCINSEIKDVKQSKLFCPRSRSLLFQVPHGSSEPFGDASSVVSIFKLLRVLDLEGICFKGDFPSEISLLVQFAFLAIRDFFTHMPSSVAKLSNLETLIVELSNAGNISLLDILWNLHKLKYLRVMLTAGIVKRGEYRAQQDSTILEGETWEIEEGEFSQLRILKMKWMNLVRWRAGDDQLECLQKLVLKGCKNLEDMPCNCLENIQTLETIKAFYCSETTEELVKQIEEQQVEQLGNSNLKSGSLLPQLISGSLPTIDDISKLIGSALELLRENHYLTETKALIEQLKVLQTLIIFVEKPTQELLAHANNVVIHIHLFFTCPRALHQLGGEMLRDSPTTWAQTISPSSSPMVCEIYTQSLRSSKLSRQSSAPTDQVFHDGAFIATKDFIDFLVDHLWELLRLNNIDFLVSVKDQMQELYHNLRSLRTILLKQQLQLNTKADIVSLLCDAGVLVISLFQIDTKVDLGCFHDLLKTFKTILLQLGEEDQPVPDFNFPKTNQLGYVDFVLEKLVDLRSSEAEPIPNSNHVQTLHQELLFLRFVLGDIVEFHLEHEELQTLWNRVLEAVMEEIRDIKSQIEINRSEIEGKRQQNRLKEATRTYHHQPSKMTSLEANDVVVGFSDDAKLIMDRLKRGPKQLKVIAIVGMPGLGKTTLASKVYNDDSISLHFQVHAWCPVSQALDKKNVLFQLLKQVDPNSSCSELSEQDLVEKLWRSLKGKRYLLYLDDIWDNEAWNSLAPAFPDDKCGSRILLTSRNQGIAPSHMLDQEPHFLKSLNEKESWELLQRKLFPGMYVALPELVMQFVAYSKGLPLTIIIVAGILATTAPEDWDKIWEDLNSCDASVTEQCTDSLELSYKCLPDHLKPCLLYFAAFPEDAEIQTTKLFYLWVAEGFVRETDGKRIKDVAEDYLNGLIGRSLVMGAKKRWNGEVKTCRIHDLLRDYSLQKAKDDGFLHLVKGICKLLRVLDLEKIKFGSEFPSEISLLVQLAFLAIQGDFDCIPSCIGKLLNLETLILHPIFDSIPLPDSLWNLQKLKYLCIGAGGGDVPIENIDKSPVLYELDEFSGARIPYNCSLELERLVAKFPNIRKLRCFISCNKDNKSENPHRGIIVRDFLTHLESLSLSSDINQVFKFGFPNNLKKLKLRGFILSGENMSTIGELPNLQVLELHSTRFEGDTWETKEMEFSQLRILKLRFVDLVSWIANDDQFECLQMLVLEECDNLEEIPCHCLENILTLETIVVVNPSEATRKSEDQTGGAAW
ncbi:OLC1v1014066C2 [Oldenlandia corymbosa var. corymbosa]|uniref:OLC1v1014066C2 n=1 Tax=Oldenlandia corymbosa var. corymbosa TaxID=529605 RepID=A0AAV1DZX1_OLDCO|nr:OLC1v1014066C2 [Oldenlandia corymbosa var. corymbosa]